MQLPAAERRRDRARGGRPLIFAHSVFAFFLKEKKIRKKKKYLTNPESILFLHGEEPTSFCFQGSPISQGGFSQPFPRNITLLYENPTNYFTVYAFMLILFTNHLFFCSLIYRSKKLILMFGH
jgi:hypothetical protein